MLFTKTLFNLRIDARNTGGFTLVELLMASAILPVVLFAVFANMSSGMRAWKTLSVPVAQEETVVFMNRVQSDFGGLLVYADEPFVGEGARVLFMGTVLSPKELGGDQGIGRIGYRLDDSRHSIIREEWNYSQRFKDAPPRSQEVLRDVQRLTFEYLTFVPTESAYVWKDAWQGGKRPVPAAIRLTFVRTSGESWVKSFTVPSGN